MQYALPSKLRMILDVLALVISSASVMVADHIWTSRSILPVQHLFIEIGHCPYAIYLIQVGSHTVINMGENLFQSLRAYVSDDLQIQFHTTYEGLIPKPVHLKICEMLW